MDRISFDALDVGLYIDVRPSDSDVWANGVSAPQPVPRTMYCIEYRRGIDAGSSPSIEGSELSSSGIEVQLRCAW